MGLGAAREDVGLMPDPDVPELRVEEAPHGRGYRLQANEEPLRTVWISSMQAQNIMDGLWGLGVRPSGVR